MSSSLSLANHNLTLVIGDPISHSLSPRMHNAAYSAAQLPFTMAAARVTRHGLQDAINGVRALGIKGLAVTMPHKIALLELLDSVDPLAQRIGAVNTVLNRDGQLFGFNTDWIGIVKPLERLTPLKGKQVAILGAGGAALAAIFGCTEAGASVTVFNRTLDKLDSIVERFGCDTGDLRDDERIAASDIIINTTSVGMGELRNETPIPASTLSKHQIVFETIYSPHTTQMLQDALRVGATVLRGFDMFLEQGATQFEIHTSVNAPRDAMREILLQATT
jgi:shikimate dehydrogenase